MEIDDQLGFVDDINVEEVDADEQVEISYTGYPVYKTLNELYQEKDFGRFLMLSWKSNNESTLPIFWRNRIKPLDVTSQSTLSNSIW
ncbi:hypothetical protein M3699_10035 [Peribacillus simplex]|uniref:hypothetical protein n=1 Tax=Peribacillus simplex TaxID=1478 RepID=UPI00203EA85A|nr:hypothetical protein [Peribacillus simplex]MCM3674220.1 hypothetical protein [Peribacillus simplex]